MKKASLQKPWCSAGFFSFLLVIMGALVAIFPSTAKAVPISYADPKAFHTQADADTSSSYSNIFTNTPNDNGRVWTDKSVSAGTGATADEFRVKLSALAQSVQKQQEDVPSDTVFVLDVSRSMMDPTEPNAPSKITVMVEALNKAINILMNDNPANRIAVVAFGGDTQQAQTPRAVPILKLNRYQEITDGIYFSMASPGYVQIDTDIDSTKVLLPITDERTANGQIRVYGGTATQWGIYEGAKMLTNEAPPKIYGDENDEPPKPNIVLLTDGEPTFGWTDFTFSNAASHDKEGFSNGNGNDVQMGQEILTVLTASYFKQQVSKHYYPTDFSQKAGFYTIGLGVEDSDDARATLNPTGVVGSSDQINAAKIRNSLGGTTYDMRETLDNVIRGGRASFPAIVKRSGSREVVDVAYPNTFPLRDRITSYNYADYYGEAANISELNQFFSEITARITSQGDYATSVINDPTGMYESEHTSYADYSGAVVFSDVIGEIMEFKRFDHLSYHGKAYNGAVFAAQMSEENPGETLASTHGPTTTKVLNTMFSSQLFFKKITNAHSNPATVQTIMEELLASSLKAGDGGTNPDNFGIYFNSPTDFGNRLRFYADNEGTWVANYFNADGTVNTTTLNGATSIIDQYYVSGATTNIVSGNPSDLTYSIFEVVTALTNISVPETNFTVSGPSTIQPHTVTTRVLKSGQQLTRWIIPASLLPLRSVKPIQGGGFNVEQTTPISFVYTVGLRSNFFLDDPDVQAYTNSNGYKFYSNAWDGSGNTNDTLAHFIPGADNPYYYDLDSNDNIPEPVASANEVPKSTNQTETDTYSTGTPQESSGVWHYPLGNNGQLEVPRAKLTVTKNWSDKLDGSFVKPEHLQLYRNGVPMGNPEPVNPNGRTATAEWLDLQLYESEADANGNAQLVNYTLEEGTWNPPNFVPYGTSGPFRIEYAQPTLDTDGSSLIATVANLPAGANYWVVDIQKNFDVTSGDTTSTLAPREIDSLLSSQNKSIDFYLFAKLDGDTTYLQVPLSDLGKNPTNEPMRYPEDFTNGERGIWLSTQETEAASLTLLLVEVTSDASLPSGYQYDSPATSGPNAISTADLGGYDLQSWNLDSVVNGQPTQTQPFAFSDINQAHAYEIEVAAKGTANFNIINHLTPLPPPSTTLTLNKQLSGITSDDFAASFVIEGWESEGAASANDLTKRIYYRSVDYGSTQMPDGEVSLSGLPLGYYTVTEYTAASYRRPDDSTSDEDDFITLEKTLGVADAGASLVNNQTVRFSLAGGGTGTTINLTNSYTPVVKTPPGSNPPPSDGGGGEVPPAEAPQCQAAKPGERAPDIYQATRNSNNSITLFFHTGDEPFTEYLLRYALAGNDFTFGATIDDPRSGKVTINDLAPGQTYQFQLIPMNDCQSGPYSNVFPVSLGRLPKIPGVPNTGLALQL